MKFKTTNYGNRKEILKFPDHYVNVAITVSDAGVSPNAEGRKVVPAGTILGGGVLADETKLAVKATTGEDGSNAEGVLFYDVDVTDGPAKGAMLIHGFIDTGKLPAAPTDEEVAALKQITFVE
ncbi:head decoration protein [Sporosarcina contaminans]|uniref:Head decoration protein n=1 Tax=Sporosarcina contaminans TaxID=633403 RepID=A0ABW3U1P1_9BACL